MYKKLILLLILTFVASTAHANVVSCDDALAVAKDFFDTTDETVYCLKAFAPDSAANPACYIINNRDGGYVVVSGDRRIRKILAYSRTGSLDADNIPPAMLNMFTSLKKNSGTLEASAGDHISWSEKETAATESKILPTALWSQRAPFNNYCPMIEGERAVVGCVGTAMSIIMKYHNFPGKGSGANSYDLYTPEGVVEVGCDFSQLNFDWDNMKEKYIEGEYTDAEAHAVATLCNAVSCSVDMDFGSSSSASESLPEFALPVFFGYSPKITYIQRQNYTKEEWFAILKAEIDANRPVFYLITAHAIVIDGYDDNGMLHYNWGWGREDNRGFAAIDDFWPGEDLEQAICSQSAVIHIEPGQETEKYRNDIAFFDQYIKHEKARLLSIDTDMIESGESYPTMYFVRAHKSFDAHIGLALVDASDNIKEVFDFGHLNVSEQFPNTAEANISSDIQSAVFLSPVSDDDYLALVASDDGTDNWLFVRHSLDRGITLPVTGNTSGKIRIVFDEIAPELKVSRLGPGLDYVYVPSAYYEEYHSDVSDRFEIERLSETPGKTVIRVNHDRNNYFNYYTPSTTYEIYPLFSQNDDYGSGYFNVTNEFSDIHLSVLYYPEESLSDITIDNITPGTIHQRVADNERVSTLCVSGNISETDFRYISGHLPLLSKLDLSGIESITPVYSTATNSIPGGAFCRNMTEVKLPECTRRLEQNSFNYCRINNVQLPASVVEIEDGAFKNCDNLRQVQLDNSELASIDTKPFDGSRIAEDAALYVPAYTKNMYEQSQAWSCFAYINEGSPDPNNFSTHIIDGIEYEVFVKAQAIGSKESEFPNDYRIADSISVNGTSYDVHKIAGGSFTQLNCNSFDTGDNVLSIGHVAICGNFNHLILGENITNITPSSIIPNFPDRLSVYMCNSRFLNADDILPTQCRYFTSSITPNFSLRGCNEVYIPGGSASEYADKFDNIKEMWTYSIKTDCHTIEVVPQSEDIVIEHISLNGKSLVSNGTSYAYDPDTEEMSVEITFSVNGLRPMTTFCDNDFNSRVAAASIAEVDSTPCVSFPANVYTIGGTLVLKAACKEDLQSLHKGIYVIGNNVVVIGQ